MTAPRLAQVEVIDADGRGVRLIDVFAWPLRIGRALDNDLVLPDPHVAAHHASVEPDADGRLHLSVGDSHNGVRIEQGHSLLLLRAGERAALPVLARWHLGHSQLLLRCPQDPLAAELPLVQAVAPGPRWLLPALALVALAWLLASRWINSDADTKWHEHVGAVLGAGSLLFVWGLLWALISKLFTGRFTPTPHIRLALSFGLGLMTLDLLLMVLAFSADLPLLSHLRGTVSAIVAAVWMAWHLRLVQPQRSRQMAVWVAACTVLGLATAMVATWYRSDRLLDELYAPNLMPPSWRMSSGQPVTTLLDELRTLEQPLRERAAKAKAEDFEPEQVR